MQKVHNDIALLTGICSQYNCRLLYATQFGSILYGTTIEGRSDIDIRGIFLPNINEVLLGKAAERLHYSTGNAHARNTSADIDIDLCSLNKWLLNLLPQGDIGALDLLFSPTNKTCVIYCEPFMERIFQNSHEFINLHGQKSYTNYSMRQAKKYGIQGSWLGTIKKVCEWLENLKWGAGDGLEMHLNDLIANCANDKYCFPIRCGKEKSVAICGKTYPASWSMEEFSNHIHAIYDKFGTRAKAAMAGRDLDWKALSHAVRALDQVIELNSEGSIHFPLKNTMEIMKIKKGLFSWPEVEKIIIEKLQEAENACLCSPHAFNYNMQLAEKTVLEAYNFYFRK